MAVQSKGVIGTMAPYLVVSDVGRSLPFYRDQLGFEVVYQIDEPNTFFAVLRRDGAMLFLRSRHDVDPLPNPKRHPEFVWDAYSYTPDPDALAAEFAGRGARFSKQLGNNDSGLRGFELTDPDGHVLFYGRPLEAGD
ncbi:MAG: VOC family protein [Sphingobium sp.]|nr:VOC family protein [Sphingobium sp.]